MIAINTNRPEYRNDIAEEIRLFLGLSEIVLLDEINPADAELIFDLQLTRNGTKYELAAKAGTCDDRSAFALPENATALTVKKLEKEAKMSKREK